MGSLELNDGGRIIKVDEGVLRSRVSEEALLGSSIYKRPYKIGSENPVSRQ